MGVARSYRSRQDTKLKRKTHRIDEDTQKRVELVVIKGDFGIDRRRANDPEHGIYYEGYASVFNTPDSYKDIITPKAFDKSLKQKGPRKLKDGTIDSDIPALWQHNPDWPMGLTVVANADEKGLYQRSNLPNNDTNQERLDWMEYRAVKGQSIGFITIKAEWDESEADEDEYWPTRYIHEIDLWEHSAVTFPAHSDALTEIVRRNREISLAVKSADHSQVLEFATKHRGTILPAVQEAIAIFKSYENVLVDGDLDGESEEEPIEDGSEGEAGEAGEGSDEPGDLPDPDDPIVNGETSEEDSEFIKSLEDFAFEWKARSVKRAITRSGGR